MQDTKLSKLESENWKMRVELEEFRTDAMHSMNQFATIRRLEEPNRQLELQAILFCWRSITSTYTFNQTNLLLVKAAKEFQNSI